VKKHAIRLGRCKPLLWLLGASPRHAYLEVAADQLRLRFGSFEERIPLPEIAWAAPGDWPLWRGVGWRIGRDCIGLIGSLEGVVEIALTSRRRTTVMFVPWRYRRLFVSLEQPEALLEDLRGR